MEVHSKKILKRAKPGAHGRSKFSVNQAIYIAERLRAAFLKTKVGNFRQIKRLMLEFSREFLSKGGKGRDVSNLGATTIYTFLEKNDIPAPTKIQRTQSKVSIQPLDIKFESVKDSVSYDTNRTEAQPTIDLLEAGESTLIAELEKRKKEVEQLESKLGKFNPKPNSSSQKVIPIEPAIIMVPNSGNPQPVCSPQWNNFASKTDQQPGFAFLSYNNRESTTSNTSMNMFNGFMGGFPGMDGILGRPTMPPMMPMGHMMNPGMTNNTQGQLMMIWGIINQFMHCMLQNQRNGNTINGNGS
jgi:hypothetical protein